MYGKYTILGGSGGMLPQKKLVKFRGYTELYIWLLKQGYGM